MEKPTGVTQIFGSVRGKPGFLFIDAEGHLVSGLGKHIDEDGFYVSKGVKYDWGGGGVQRPGLRPELLTPTKPKVRKPTKVGPTTGNEPRGIKHDSKSEIPTPTKVRTVKLNKQVQHDENPLTDNTPKPRAIPEHIQGPIPRPPKPKSNHPKRDITRRVYGRSVYGDEPDPPEEIFVLFWVAMIIIIIILVTR